MQHAISYDFLPYKSYVLTITIGVVLIDRGDYNPDTLSRLLSAVDMLSICGEYKLWLYRNYIVSLLRFHLSVDAITKHAITKLENLAGAS